MHNHSPPNLLPCKPSEHRKARLGGIHAHRFAKPRLEAELAFLIMGADLEGPGARIYDVMRATEMVMPALEIIDYRTEVPRAITDTIADIAAFAAIVVAGRPVRPTCLTAKPILRLGRC